MKVTYFFRKPFQDYHSIEGVFENVQFYLKDKVQVRNYELKRYSSGILNRILSCFEVNEQQEDVNHITGDIHFIALGLNKRKTVLTIHDLAPLRNSRGLKHEILKFFWYQLPIWRVRYVTVISEFTKKELLQTVKVNAEKVIVIPNPLPADLKYHEKNQLSNKPILLQVGTAYNKNLEGLIQAIEGMEVRLLILGKLSTHQLELLKAKEIDYENAFNLEYNEVVAYYKRADIVCFATFYEGFGLPILEAQKIGRAVITSNRCAMPETAGAGALLIDPENPDDYREAICSLIQNEERRKSLIEAGLKNVERFEGTAVSQRYYDLYRKLHDTLR